jgi:hypothetical protein
MNRTLAHMACAVLLAAPAWVSAQSYQLTAYTRANTNDFLKYVGLSDYKDLNWIDKPQALGLNALEARSATGGGGATASFLGTIGLLKAYASATYPGCCDPQGRTVAYGYANGTAQGGFYDTVLVAGAGLAAGTPVQYRLDIRIDGGLTSPNFEIGGALSAEGIAEARLVDTVSRQESLFRWDAKKQATGVYSLTLDTQVGRTLSINGLLFADAYVGSGATTARSAASDFYHSAGYTLAPSVAGLNTVGASGHDFMVAVPEPGSMALAGCGLMPLVGVVRRRRRAGGMADSHPATGVRPQ